MHLNGFWGIALGTMRGGEGGASFFGSLSWRMTEGQIIDPQSTVHWIQAFFKKKKKWPIQPQAIIKVICQVQF